MARRTVQWQFDKPRQAREFYTAAHAHLSPAVLAKVRIEIPWFESHFGGANNDNR
jgi:hypothetical protein